VREKEDPAAREEAGSGSVDDVGSVVICRNREFGGNSGGFGFTAVSGEKNFCFFFFGSVSSILLILVLFVFLIWEWWW
jgi:hypothetical protein